MSKKYNLKQSSERLGIDRKTLRKWLYDMNIDPPKGDDRRSRILTTTELEEIAEAHSPTLKPDPKETNISNPNLPEHKLNQFRAEIRDAKSEVNNLKERLSHLEKRLQDQEDKANKEIRAMHEEILVLKSRLEKHLDHH